MDHQAFAQLLGNYGEFVGAIAVVVTLAYLAVQIRQSTKATKSQTAQGTFLLSFEVVNSIAQQGNVGLWRRFMANGLTDLEPDEQLARCAGGSRKTTRTNAVETGPVGGRGWCLAERAGGDGGCGPGRWRAVGDCSH